MIYGAVIGTQQLNRDPPRGPIYQLEEAGGSSGPFAR